MLMHFKRRTVRLVLLGAIFLLGAYFLYQVRGIMLPFVLAVLLSYILNPFVVFLEQYRFSRTLALVVIYIIGLAVLTGAFAYGIPVVVRELTELGKAIPDIVDGAQDLVVSVHNRYRNMAFPPSIQEVVTDNLRNLEDTLVQWTQTAINTLLGFFSNLFSLVLAPILAFYLLKDWDHIGRRIRSLFPVEWESAITSLWEEVDRVLVGFIRGYLFVSVLVGILTGIGLSLIGMNYVVLLAIIAGLTNFIPYFGPVIAAVPVVFLGLIESTRLAVQALLVMVVVQQLESNMITPAVLGESVGLHPIAIVFVLLAGGSLFGLLGMLLAVPVAAVLRIIFGYFYANLVQQGSDQ